MCNLVSSLHSAVGLAFGKKFTEEEKLAVGVQHLDHNQQNFKSHLLPLVFLLLLLLLLLPLFFISFPLSLTSTLQPDPFKLKTGGLVDLKDLKGSELEG